MTVKNGIILLPGRGGGECAVAIGQISCFFDCTDNEGKFTQLILNNGQRLNVKSTSKELFFGLPRTEHDQGDEKSAR